MVVSSVQTPPDSDVPRHHSLLAWKEAREVARLALRVCRTQWRPSASALFSRLQRSSLSIQLNIAEGYALADRGRFANHLAVAYGSAVETRDILELAVEEGILPREGSTEILARCQRCERLLLGLLKRYRPIPKRVR